MTTLVRIVAKVYLAVLHRRTAVKFKRLGRVTPQERAVPTNFYPLS
jgi:hypothetical protein